MALLCYSNVKTRKKQAVYSPRLGKMKPFHDLSVSVSECSIVLGKDIEEKEERRGEKWNVRKEERKTEEEGMK
jgi:hypothetical protein